MFDVCVCVNVCEMRGKTSHKKQALSALKRLAMSRIKKDSFVVLILCFSKKKDETFLKKKRSKTKQKKINQRSLEQKKERFFFVENIYLF